MHRAGRSCFCYLTGLFDYRDARAAQVAMAGERECKQRRERVWPRLCTWLRT